MTGVTSGTVEDSFGNTMTSTDVPSASSLANSAISVDYEAPSITSFSVRNTSGEDISLSVVGVGDTLTIVAQMSEAISPSSSDHGYYWLG